MYSCEQGKLFVRRHTKWIKKLLTPETGINMHGGMGGKSSHSLSAHYSHWLKATLDYHLSKATTVFFGKEFKAIIVGITEKPLYFWKENDYFVTQVAPSAACNIQLRVSNTASGILLDESLGVREDNETYFKFKNITRLESEILSAYCNFFYKTLGEVFIEKRKIQRKKDIGKELIHLTILINTPERIEEDKPCGKIIVSFPVSILKQPEIPEPDYPVDISKYYSAIVETNVFIGTAIINLEDLKKIGQNDVIILDNSNLKTMYVFNDDHTIKFRVKPDQSIILNIHNEEYDDMTDEMLGNINPAQAIWDNIQVEVGAEFKKIKLPLGELRNMTEGLVVEVASLVDNEVRLHIDGKDLAIGELVIVGDKYGVMINKVLHKEMPQSSQNIEDEIIDEPDEIVESNLDDDDDISYDDLGLDDDF